MILERKSAFFRVASSILTALSTPAKYHSQSCLHVPYVVYKAEHLHNTWIEGGSSHVRYNRSRSGWFDETCFADWFDSVVIPYCRRLKGTKVMIGDNLSSHFSQPVIGKCIAMDIKFVCIPPNTTHLCQPLDVSVFASVKKNWRRILTEWKIHEGGNLSLLPKNWFPRLLSRLLDSIQANVNKSIISGFRKCGIVPLNKAAVTRPACDLQESNHVSNSITNQLLVKLRMMHESLKVMPTKQRKKRLNVVPGKIEMSRNKFDR